MCSFKASVIAAAALTAGFALSVPAAHAATAPQSSASAECKDEVAVADKAEAAFNAAAEDIKEEIARGGHPSAAEKANLASLLNAANLATSDASRVCGVEREEPHGTTHTGVGSMSQGTDTIEVAAGLGLLGAIGAGAVAMRRRRAGSEA